MDIVEEALKARHAEEGTGEPRAFCYRCRRPKRVCYCEHITSLDTRTRLVFLQHLRERRMPIGTARMAHLGLPNSEFHVGIDFAQHPRVREITAAEGTFILFPGPKSRDVTELAPGELKSLVVVDGTWPLARKLIKVNPVLQTLPQVAFRPARPGNYRIRKEPAEHCLSTIEAVAEILGHLEGEPERFRQMLRAFDAMVDAQIEFAQDRAGPSRYKVHKPRRPSPREQVARELTELLPRLVLVYGESNARLNETGERKHELIHLVALRPASGERFELLMRPSAAMDETTPHHAELLEREILEGEARDAAVARWRAFLRDGDVLCGWGHFTQALLSTVSPPCEFVDLRHQVIRVHKSKPGGLDEAAAKYGASASSSAGRGRAGRRLVALESVLSSLVPGP